MQVPSWLGTVSFARSGRFGNYAVLIIAASLCVATAALVWFGYVATREWRRGTEMLQERRRAEALALVSAALDRDMKGAVTSLIIPMDHPTFDEDPPYDLRLLTAQLFAKYPYPESLLIWRAAGSTTGTTYSFNRAERRPAWEIYSREDEPFPVTLQKNPTGLADLIAQVRRAHQQGRPFSAINVEIGGGPYQVMAHYFTNPAPPFALSGFAALTVNMNWVRTEYFQSVLQQAATIGGNVGVLSFAVHDQADNVLATTGPRRRAASNSYRAFPALFIDQALLTPGQLQKNDIEWWKVRVDPTSDDAFAAASAGSQRSFLLIAISAVITIGALIVTLRAVEAKSALAAMKSDFVAAVTHELKTPVAIIRLVGETLASGRYTASAVDDYAKVLSREAGRLGKAIDQLLTYARYSQAQRPDALQLSTLRMDELLETAIDHLRPALSASGCDLQMEVPSSLPPVQVDRTAVLHVIENIVDNALKYARGTPVLRISGHVEGALLALTFADQGIGIARDEVEHVLDRFYRAKNAMGAGSGLGLTIAKRILEFHGGQIRVRSTVNTGTEIALLFPILVSS